MKKSALFFWTLFRALCVGTALHAEIDLTEVPQVAMAHAPANPVLRLPGMRSMPKSIASFASPRPTPVISDVINVPNPFDSRKPGREGQTQISYRLEVEGPVTIALYDLLGVRVQRWAFRAGENGGKAGANVVWWDGTNEAGQKVSKGGYLAQIEVETPETVATVIRKIGVIH
jgi:hypothetical protein